MCECASAFSLFFSVCDTTFESQVVNSCGSSVCLFFSVGKKVKQNISEGNSRDRRRVKVILAPKGEITSADFRDQTSCVAPTLTLI